MDDGDDEIRTVSAVCSDNEGELVIIAEQEEEQVETMTNEIIENPCWGCRTQQPNQLAHMSPGGCLYTEDDELVEVQEFQGVPAVIEVTDAANDVISDAESV
uniref:Uncharacterized protein n=1 Tax=viral metagenome TaxID=1070528 RepID=A0A6C0DTH6_9ZZZZ